MKNAFESLITAAAIAALAIAVPAVGQDLGNGLSPAGAGADCPALAAEKALLLAERQSVKGQLAEAAAAKKDADPALAKQLEELEARLAEIKAAGC
jgi:hypothetical protein